MTLLAIPVSVQFATFLTRSLAQYGGAIPSRRARKKNASSRPPKLVNVMLRPCLGCGSLAESASRCEPCRLADNRVRDSKRDQSKRALYSGAYRREAKKIREEAQFCWLCGEAARLGDPWQADHVIPDQPTSLLRAAHRSCNIKRALLLRHSSTGGGG